MFTTSKPRLGWVDWTQWALVVAMFAIGAVVWPLAPDHVPVHWNLAGQVDRYGGKLEGLFALPATALVVVLALRFLPRIDPHRARYTEFAQAYAVIRLAITTVLAGLYGVVMLSTLGIQLNIGLVVGLLVGLLLVVIGAVLDQLRPNWFVGIRTPWTLSSERSWVATHRAGRWVFIAIGLAIALAGAVQSAWAVATAVIVAILGLVGLVVYSYLVWREEPR